MTAPLVALALDLVAEHDDEILVGAYNALKAFVERRLEERKAARRILDADETRVAEAEAAARAFVASKPE